jgi:hypothetical protein
MDDTLLHETMNMFVAPPLIVFVAFDAETSDHRIRSYISADSYVFEPSSSQPGLMISEKAERETLTVDRRSGKMTLNGGCHNAIHAPGERTELISLVIASQLSVPARNNSPPLGREKVITCYGIIGIVSLATSRFPLQSLPQQCRI